MAKQRVVNVKFWDDTHIMKLDPTEKLLFLYFLTNPLTNISGIYEISLRRIAFDTGIDGDMVDKIMKRFEKDKKIIYREGWIYLINFVKNQNWNPSVISGIIREISCIPIKIKDKLEQAVSGCIQEGTPNLTKPNLTEQDFSFNKSYKKKPYYQGCEMRKKYGKWYVIPKDGGQWLIYSDKESKIEWK